MSFHDDPTNCPTPLRSTALTLDQSEKVLIETGLNCRRAGVEVARHIAEGVIVNGSESAKTLRLWKSGVWSLAPLQQNIASVHEETAGQSSILAAADFSLMQYSVGAGASASFGTRNSWAQASGLTNPGYTVDIASSGGPFLYKTIPSGANLNPAAVAGNAALSTALPQVTLPGANVPMDRNARSVASYPADQGWFLQWSCGGTYHSYPKFVWCFYFGDQYALAFTGDGKALLYEYCRATSGGAYRWVKRTKWQYSSPKAVMGTSHTLAIFPHVSLSGQKFLSFANNQLDIAQSISQIDRSHSPNVSPDEFVYRADPGTRGGDVDEAGSGHAVKAGYVHWDSRRDLRLSLQVSKLAWETGGVLTDLAESLGTAVANTNAVVLTMAKTTPTGTSITGVVKDAATGATFVPGTDKQPYAEFTFSGDGTKTPLLYAYRMKQDEVVQTVTPGAFAVDVTAGPGVNLTTFAGDPAEESGLIAAHDLSGTHTRLTKRGRFRASLATSFTPPAGRPGAGTPTSVALGEGYVLRPRSTQVGRGGGQGLWGATPRTWPDPKWKTYALPWQGMYLRLAERVAPTKAQFWSDPSDILGRPFKVTDVIKNYLLCCGFDSTQVSIPDLPYRLWAGHTWSLEDAIIDPGATVAESLVRMVRNYLGAYLYFDPTLKKWTLLFGAQAAGDGTFTPVYHFVTDPPAAGQAVHDPNSYAADTTFVEDLSQWTVPPDFNSIIVSADTSLSSPSARVKTVAYAYNPLSYAVPGMSTAPDPEHPDYIGYCKPYEVIDPSLMADTPEATWAAVSWTCRRLYDFLCHGQRLASFRCPLPILYDATLSAWRMLRFQDPVSLDGENTWLVKSVTLRYGTDRYQSADVELIQPVAGQYFVGADGGPHRRRQAVRRLSAHANGSGDGGKLYGNLAVSGAAEHRHRRYPLYNPTQVPLQDNTGVFYSMPGWLTATGADG